MNQSAVWQVGLSLFEHGILTSRPDERNEINKLLQTEGNIKRAVTTWVHRIQAAATQQYGQ